MEHFLSGKTTHIADCQSFVQELMDGTLVTEIFVDDVVDEVLNGFSNSKQITCPICKATIDLISQDLESESNFYFCANCGFTLPKPRK
jgi:predicted RNA-binding Zn-ribbon protein involved in translation (DUF1610 family)